MTTVEYRFETLNVGGAELRVRRLLDHNQFSDDEGEAEQLGISDAQWSLFGQLWPAGNVLMHLMSEFDIDGRRVLEIGCGIGLASLILARRGADITATDIHPEVAELLRENAASNGIDDIPFVRLDWNDPNDELGRFDLIIGADVLYERPHAEALAAFVGRHGTPACEVLVVDAGRSHTAVFRRAMEEQGFAHTKDRPDTTSYFDVPFKGGVHTFVRNTDVRNTE